jgi:hypothetical protein
VALRRYGSGNIDEVHHLATQEVSQGIGVIGEHDLHGLGCGFSNGFAW